MRNREVGGRLHPSKSQTAQETPDAAVVHDFVAPVNWTMLYVYVMNLQTTAQHWSLRKLIPLDTRLWSWPKIKA